MIAIQCSATAGQLERVLSTARAQAKPSAKQAARNQKEQARRAQGIGHGSAHSQRQARRCSGCQSVNKAAESAAGPRALVPIGGGFSNTPRNRISSPKASASKAAR